MEVYTRYAELECRLFFDVEQDIAMNTSRLTLRRLEWRNVAMDLPYASWVIGTVKVNGVVAKEMILSGTVGYPVDLQQAWDGFNVNGTPVTVNHNPDGSAAVTIFVRSELTSRGDYRDVGGLQRTVVQELPRIPRVSDILAEPVTLGEEMTIQLARAAEGFRDTVAWSCGEASGVLAEKSAETVFRWTPAPELAAQAPDSAVTPVVLKVTTFTGDTQVGTGELTVQCRVPETAVPSFAVELSDSMGYLGAHGGYIQDQSRLRVQTAASGALGSQIREILVTCCGLRSVGADVTFTLPDSGNVSVLVAVTDSRGRRTEQQFPIAVLPYSRPAVTIRSAFRCDAEGHEQPDGSYAMVTFDAELTAVQNGTAAYTVVQQVHGSDQTLFSSLPEYADRFRLQGASALLRAGIDSSYDCRIRVRDSFAQVESLPVLVPVAFALLDLCRRTKAVGIGMRAKNNGKLSIGLDADMDEHRLSNLADPVSDQDAATKAYVDRRLQALAEALGLTE